MEEPLSQAMEDDQEMITEQISTEERKENVKSSMSELSQDGNTKSENRTSFILGLGCGREGIPGGFETSCRRW